MLKVDIKIGRENYKYLGISNKILVNSLSEVNAIRKQQRESLKLKNKSACFNIKFNKDKNIIPRRDIYDCQSYSFIDNNSGQGLWDKPCTKDSECLFNGANKNYPNKFGKMFKKWFLSIARKYGKFRI